MALPMLLYGSKKWVTTKWDERRTEAAEMRFLRAVRECSRLDRLRSEDIRKELIIIRIHEIKQKYS